MEALTNSVKIRTLRIEDYDSITKLWQNTEGVKLTEVDSKANIQVFLESNPELSVVAEKDGEIVGAVLSGHDGRRGFLHHLAVRQDLRGKGIGSELVKVCLERLKAVGIDKCHIFVVKDNEEGMRFWNKIGWETRTDIQAMSQRT